MQLLVKWVYIQLKILKKNMELLGFLSNPTICRLFILDFTNIISHPMLHC